MSSNIFKRKAEDMISQASHCFKRARLMTTVIPPPVLPPPVFSPPILRPHISVTASYFRPASNMEAKKHEHWKRFTKNFCAKVEIGMMFGRPCSQGDTKEVYAQKTLKSHVPRSRRSSGCELSKYVDIPASLQLSTVIPVQHWENIHIFRTMAAANKAIPERSYWSSLAASTQVSDPMNVTAVSTEPTYPAEMEVDSNGVDMTDEMVIDATLYEAGVTDEMEIDVSQRPAGSGFQSVQLEGGNDYSSTSDLIAQATPTDNDVTMSLPSAPVVDTFAPVQAPPTANTVISFSMSPSPAAVPEVAPIMPAASAAQGSQAGTPVASPSRAVPAPAGARRVGPSSLRITHSADLASPAIASTAAPAPVVSAALPAASGPAMSVASGAAQVAQPSAPAVTSRRPLASPAGARGVTPFSMLASPALSSASVDDAAAATAGTTTSASPSAGGAISPASLTIAASGTFPSAVGSMAGSAVPSSSASQAMPVSTSTAPVAKPQAQAASTDQSMTDIDDVDMTAAQPPSPARSPPLPVPYQFGDSVDLAIRSRAIAAVDDSDEMDDMDEGGTGQVIVAPLTSPVSEAVAPEAPTTPSTDSTTPPPDNTDSSRLTMAPPSSTRRSSTPSSGSGALSLPGALLSSRRSKGLLRRGASQWIRYIPPNEASPTPSPRDMGRDMSQEMRKLSAIQNKRLFKASKSSKMPSIGGSNCPASNEVSKVLRAARSTSGRSTLISASIERSRILNSPTLNAPPKRWRSTFKLPKIREAAEARTAEGSVSGDGWSDMPSTPPSLSSSLPSSPSSPSSAGPATPSSLGYDSPFSGMTSKPLLPVATDSDEELFAIDSKGDAAAVLDSVIDGMSFDEWRPAETGEIS